MDFSGCNDAFECLIKMRKQELSLDEISQFLSFLKQYFSIPVCSLHEPNFVISLKDNNIWKANICCKTARASNQYSLKLESKGCLGYIRGKNQAILYDNDSNSIKSKCAGTTKSEIVQRFIEWSQDDEEALSICHQIKVHDLRSDEGSPIVTK